MSKVIVRAAMVVGTAAATAEVIAVASVGSITLS